MYASALDFQGLYTFPNPLAKVPVGACLIADNLVANKDSIAESRRGRYPVGSSLDFSGGGGHLDSLFFFQNYIFAVDDNVGNMYNASTASLTWSTISPANVFFPPLSTVKNHYQEANKNLYVTTSNGIFKIATAGASAILAGVPPGLDGTGVLAGAGSGFLGSNEQCAYQIVFGYIDANGNLNLGSPSERILVVNSTGGSDNVTLTFTVPQGLSTSYFYQIYRTPQTTYSATPSLNVPPGAEPQLSAQYNLTSGQISALSVTVTDVTTDALLGAALYTNPSQQGALQPNDIPPLSADICSFSQMMFYANCLTLQSLTFNMISVGSPNGVQVGDTVVVNGITFTAANSQNNASQQFMVTTGGTVASNIDATARAFIQCVNANASLTNVYAIYLSGYGDLPGLIELQAVGYSVGSFSVSTSRTSAFSPLLPITSSNDTLPNGIYVSKLGQPEAVPAVNLIFVGGGDQPILRILPLRDRVIVIKTDGVFVITGSSPQTLSITLLDSTIICIAPESAKLLNNSVYCMSQQGVVSITESGVTIQSRAIEGDLLALTSMTYTFTNFSQATSAVSYESERLYILCVPTSSTDRYATQCYCYNWITNAWTRWIMDIVSGGVNPVDNKLYTFRAPPTAPPFTSADFVYQERKNYNYSDYMDDQYSVTITGVDTTGLIVSISGTPLSSWVGYGLDQVINGIHQVAIITAVNTGSKTVTVDLINSTSPGAKIPWINGSANVDVPIPINYMQCPITAGFPHYVKSWSRIKFWFNYGNFQQIISNILTDMNYAVTQTLAMQQLGGGYGWDPFGGSPYGGSFNSLSSVQTLVPTDNSLAHLIIPQLQLSFPYARFSCLGVTASYEIVSDVAG